MARAQNMRRGLFAKDRIDLGANQLTKNSTAVLFSGGVRLSGQANAQITGDSTGLVLVGGVKVSNQANAVISGNSTGAVVVGGVKISNSQFIEANSTGLVFEDAALSALPGNVRQSTAHIAIGTNSTGRFLAVNTTGTTWLFISGTSVQPTT